MTDRNNIRVEYLCNEPFWKFTKTGTNEYCKVCKHQIKDFTNLDKQSAFDAINEAADGTCGIFFKDQFLIDDRTQIGASFKTLLFVSSLSTLLTLNANAQNSNYESTKTEQRPDSLFKKNTEPIRQDSILKCVTYEKDDAGLTSVAYKKKHRLRIGRVSIYINGRFPFLHIHKMRRGRIARFK